MINVNRFLLTAGLLGAIVGGWRHIDQDRIAEISFDLSCLPNSVLDYQEGEQKAQELSRMDELVRDQIQRKNRLIKELVAGRVSFLETAGWFKYLNENSTIPTAGYVPFPGISQEEKYCRQVISWVKSHRKLHPKDVDENLVQRLEDDLAKLLAQWSDKIPPFDAPKVDRCASGTDTL